jgi:hypothetical protein
MHLNKPESDLKVGEVMLMILLKILNMSCKVKSRAYTGLLQKQMLDFCKLYFGGPFSMLLSRDLFYKHSSLSKT